MSVTNGTTACARAIRPGEAYGDTIGAEVGKMRIAAMIARLLLGLIFLVFGLNGLHPFLPMPPPPAGAGRAVRGCAGGFALFRGCRAFSDNRRAAAVGEPICSAGAGDSGSGDREHSVLSHFHAPNGLPLASVVAALWVIVAVWNKGHLAGICRSAHGVDLFVSRAAPRSAENH